MDLYITADMPIGAVDFFPVAIWYLYELTGDTSYLPLARKYTEAIRPGRAP